MLKLPFRILKGGFSTALLHETPKPSFPDSASSDKTKSHIKVLNTNESDNLKKYSDPNDNNDCGESKNLLNQPQQTEFPKIFGHLPVSGHREFAWLNDKLVNYVAENFCISRYALMKTLAESTILRKSDFKMDSDEECRVLVLKLINCAFPEHKRDYFVSLDGSPSFIQNDEGEITSQVPSKLYFGLGIEGNPMITRKFIIIVDNPLDALALYSNHGIPCIVLFGDGNVDRAMLPIFDGFESIFIWFPESLQEKAQLISDSLGIFRSKKLTLSSKSKDHLGNPTKLSFTDPISAMKDGINVKELIKIAINQGSTNFVNFNSSIKSHSVADGKQIILNSLNAKLEIDGTPTRRFPALNNLMLGLRRGEFTVLTGPTGCGKTTILSNLSLDWCVSGIPTLWGSFEMKSYYMMKRMMQQYYDCSEEELKEIFKSGGDDFFHLRMHFLDCHGSSPLSVVRSGIERAVRTHGIEHVVLDNLQFMTGNQANNGPLDKFALFDQIVGELRALATNLNIHITLVIHPKKTQDNAAFTINSIYGTSKATQEADNVFIVDYLDNTCNPASRLFRIVKNRYHGLRGDICMEFDASSLRFNELPQLDFNED